MPPKKTKKQQKKGTVVKTTKKKEKQQKKGTTVKLPKENKKAQKKETIVPTTQKKGKSRHDSTSRSQPSASSSVNTPSNIFREHSPISAASGEAPSDVDNNQPQPAADNSGMNAPPAAACRPLLQTPPSHTMSLPHFDPAIDDPYAFAYPPAEFGQPLPSDSWAIHPADVFTPREYSRMVAGQNRFRLRQLNPDAGSSGQMLAEAEEDLDIYVNSDRDDTFWTEANANAAREADNAWAFEEVEGLNPPPYYPLPVRLPPWLPVEEPEQPALTQPSIPPTHWPPHFPDEEERDPIQSSSISFMDLIDPRLLEISYEPIASQSVHDQTSSVALREPSPVTPLTATPTTPTPSVEEIASLNLVSQEPKHIPHTHQKHIKHKRNSLTKPFQSRDEIVKSVEKAERPSALKRVRISLSGTAPKRVRISLPEPNRYTPEPSVPNSTDSPISHRTHRSSPKEASSKKQTRSSSTKSRLSKPKIKSESRPVTPQRSASISPLHLRSATIPASSGTTKRKPKSPGHPIPTSWRSARKADKMMSLIRQTARATSVSWEKTTKIWNENREHGSEVVLKVLANRWHRIQERIGVWPGFDVRMTYTWDWPHFWGVF
jgi:hypothetical protein